MLKFKNCSPGIAACLCATAFGSIAVYGSPAHADADDVRPPARHGPQRAEGLFARLVRELRLNEDQQEQIKPLVTSYVTKSRNIRNDRIFDQDDKNEELRELHSQTGAAITRFLTAQQRGEFNEIWYHRGEKRPTFLEYLTRRLRLNEEQQEQIKPVLQRYETRQHAIWSDRNFDTYNKRSEFKELRESTERQIEAVLNAAQRPQFDKIWDRGGEKRA